MLLRRASSVREDQRGSAARAALRCVEKCGRALPRTDFNRNFSRLITHCDRGR